MWSGRPGAAGSESGGIVQFSGGSCKSYLIGINQMQPVWQVAGSTISTDVG